MKGVIFLLIITFLPNSVNAQYIDNFRKSSDKFKEKYSKFVSNQEEIERSWYHYVVTKDSESYILRQFNPEKLELLSESRFSDKRLTVQNGLSREFLPSGTIFGVYRNNLKEGQWLKINSKGDTLSKSTFYHGSISGEQIIWSKEGYLKSKIEFLNNEKNGKEIQFYSSGATWSITEYKKGKKNGDYLYYDSTGVLKQHWKYKKDEVSEYILGEKESFGANEVTPIPLFMGCELLMEEEYYNCQVGEMYKFLNKNVNYPKDALKYGMQGKVFVKFVVEKDGKIDHLEVIKGLSESMNNESLRVLGLMPNWTPGYQNGKAVRVFFTIPIIYSMQ